MPKGFFDVSPVVHDGLGYNGMRPGPVSVSIYSVITLGGRHAGYSKEDGNILKQFGAAVKAGRDGLDISQETLAEKAGLHRTYVGGVEQGRRNVSLLNIVKLSQVLGVEAASVFEHMKTIKMLKIINNNMLHRVM